MKHSIKNTLALLIVFSATMANAVDSAYMATNCVIVAEEEKLYRIEYLAAKDQQVTIQLFNDKNILVHKEVVQSSAFVKTFDLVNLPDGQYEFVVDGENYVHREEIVLDNLKGFSFNFYQRKDRKVSMVGTMPQGNYMDLYIMDKNQDVIYKQRYNEETQLHKIFNFEKLLDSEVTFSLYHDSELIAQEKVEF